MDFFKLRKKEANAVMGCFEKGNNSEISEEGECSAKKGFAGS